MKRIAITGSEGLIGRGLVPVLRSCGFGVRCLDLRLPAEHPGQGSILQRDAVTRLVAGCDGVVHLAAVSRVILGERDPAQCWDTNVLGTQAVLDAALAAASKPWVILASSREVYGQAAELPAGEDSPLQPVNVYGRSKAEAEARVTAARAQGLKTAILRFSNVYGSTQDHPDRVVPAFARAAAEGRPLRVDGSSHLFDFTHLSDTVAGIVATIQRLEQGCMLPPLHLLTGQGTTLGELAALAIQAGGRRSAAIAAPERSYDVAHFVGDPARAHAALGFRAQVAVADGLGWLVQEFAAENERAAMTGGR